MIGSLLLLSLLGTPTIADTSACAAAARFLRNERHMQAEVEVDTIDDWRTRQRVAGCRITAAGGTALGVNKEAVHFYELLRAAKWVRTPDPRDSPNEGSLRFRWEQADCLFNINAEALLATDAEQRVNDRLRVPDGQTRYQIFVMCMPAMPAAAR